MKILLTVVVTDGPLKNFGIGSTREESVVLNVPDDINDTAFPAVIQERVALLERGPKGYFGRAVSICHSIIP